MKQPHTLVRDVNFWRSPLCPGVELRQASYRRQTFHRHSHPTYSLGVVVRGVTEFVYRGQRQRAQAGDLVLIAPDEVHDCNPFDDEPLVYWMFYLDADVLGAPPQACFDRAVYRDPALFALWLSLAQGVGAWCETENAALAQLWRQELETLWRRTWQAWPCRALTAADQPEPAPWLRQVRRQLRADLTQPLALQELSARIGISPSHLSRRFGAEVGLPPHRYQLQLRIDAAKVKLAAGEPIAQVAADLGFSDQSHFTRLFTRIVGATPAQYQKS